MTTSWRINMDLTARQEQVLRLIKKFMEETGFPPTRSEIAGALGFKSANAAEDHLKALARKGAIELSPGASRGIRIITDEYEDLLPIIGRVSAGQPLLAEECVEDKVQVDPKLFQPEAHYLLRVSGMSMRDAGILEGDLLAVHKTNQVKNGQVVVARLADEVTVKRYEKKGNIVKLHPENDAFSSIIVDLKHAAFEIEGLGVGVIRSSTNL